jgi:hypothetical protein
MIKKRCSGAAERETREQDSGGAADGLSSSMCPPDQLSSDVRDCLVDVEEQIREEMESLMGGRARRCRTKWITLHPGWQRAAQDQGHEATAAGQQGVLSLPRRHSAEKSLRAQEASGLAEPGSERGDPPGWDRLTGDLHRGHTCASSKILSFRGDAAGPVSVCQLCFNSNGLRPANPRHPTAMGLKAVKIQAASAAFLQPRLDCLLFLLLLEWRI